MRFEARACCASTAAVLATLLTPWAAAQTAPPAATAPTTTADLPGDSIEPPAGNGFTYALGLAVIDGPTYAGAAGREVKLRPLWAVRYGRFRISGSRASGLLSAPGERGSGIIADLVDKGPWRVSAGLRYDSGRSSGDDPALAGLPDIKRTLRGRVAARLDMGGGWSSSLSWSSDLLGNAGGVRVGLGIDHAWQPWPGAKATVGAGGNWANALNMRTNFGIAPDVALLTGRTAFVPGSGMVDLGVGAGLTVPLAGRWTVISSVGVGQLQGSAADSPLTRKRTSATASIALAWRSR